MRVSQHARVEGDVHQSLLSRAPAQESRQLGYLPAQAKACATTAVALSDTDEGSGARLDGDIVEWLSAICISDGISAGAFLRLLPCTSS